MTIDNERHFYQPSQGHRLPHDPLNSIIGPRPIGWISTRSADGILNLAPYSFFQRVQLHATYYRVLQHGRERQP